MPRIYIARNYRLTLGSRTLIMGIVNVTPDSFSDGGEALRTGAAVRRALQHQEDGADIIDIGGESTRPGAEPVSRQEELDRVIPVIETLAGQLKIPISIDTCKSEVARRALEAGASIVNDINGGTFDPEMSRVAAEFGSGAALMHIKGEPRNMQQNPTYNDLIGEIKGFLSTAVDRFIAAGVPRERILVDPGIGFGKKLEHNLEIIRRMGEFQGLGAGVLFGPSRKSFIGLITGRPSNERLPGTIASSVVGALAGADVVRVHDVKEVVEALKVVEAIRSGRVSETLPPLAGGN